MKTRKMLPALVTAGALALAGCGSDDSGGAASGSGGQAAGNPTDRAFVAEMIPHHEGALEMAEIAQKRGESEFVKGLADDILRTQAEEITTLRREDQQLADAGVEKGALGVPGHMMGMSEDTAQLKTATPFDEAFIKMMVPHHKGAIEMAKVELAKGSDPELKTLAQQIIDAQQREIKEMTAQLGRAAVEQEQGAAQTDGKRDGTRAAGPRPPRQTLQAAAASGTGPRDVALPPSR